MSSDENPYRAPDSGTSTIVPALPIVPAERWRRFVNLIVDYACFFALSVAIGVVILFIGGESALDSMDKIPDIVFGMTLMLLYYVPMEAMFGRTVGKFVTGTCVVNEKGGPPTFGQILGRTFSRFIPFEAFSFFGASGRGVHDSLAHTYVVRCR